jgi:RimJ/RimL family protein N-acetyltransferase
MRKRLADGEEIRIRPIRPDDKPLLDKGLRDLSPRSVQRRFLTPKRRFSKAELRYLTEVDMHDHVALVAESPRAPGRLVGVGRFVRLPEAGDAADVAIVVGDCWQRRGVGSELATALAAEARRVGVRRFVATMAADNRPAQALMAKLAVSLERHYTRSGVSELSMDVAA